MNILIVLFSIALISLWGLIFINALGFLKNESFLLKLGYSFGAGVGIITYQLFIYSRLGIPYTVFNLLVPLLILLIFYLNKKRREVRIVVPKFKKLKKIEYILIFLIVLSFAYAFFEAVIRPPVAWDSWSTWLIQSKIYYMQGKIDPSTLTNFRFDYPFTVPLLGTFIYTFLGKVDDVSVLLLSTAFLGFLSIGFFAALRKRSNFLYALIFTFLLITTQNFIRHGGRLEAGIADLPVGYFAFCSINLLLEYIKGNRSYRSLIFLIIFMGITSVIKFEGLLLAITMFFCLLIDMFRNKMYYHVIISLLWTAPYLDWWTFRKFSDVKDHYYSGHFFTFTINKTVHSILGTVKELVNVKSWNLLWFAYAYSLIISNFKKNKELLVLNFVVISQIIAYLLIYIFTFGNNPESSIERLLIHIAPIVLLSVAISGFKLFTSYKSSYLNILKKLV